MKFKKIMLIFILVLFPIQVLGYSDYIIPGGTSLGIDVKSNGILVVGFYKVNGFFNKGTPIIKVGDRIISVDDNRVNTIDEMVKVFEENISRPTQKLTVLRNGKEYTIYLELIKEDETYKTGLYVKDEITGIGTLTYIDPETKIFGALGHSIVEVNTNSTIEVRTGSIFKSSITSIDRSTSGVPGGKNALFYSNDTYGVINKNTPLGIYGNFTANLPKKEPIEVATLDEVEIGDAKIITVLDDMIEEYYDIKITKVDLDSNIKNIYFTVTDERLLSSSGGIVQGMSGSPIIQNNKIIGAVTHVVISNPSKGYGISIVKMLEEGEK